MKKVALVLFLPIIALSIALMQRTLSYSDSNLLIGGKYWSDFGAQLPLIRFFSQTSPWPIDHPLFPKEKIKYHFLFYQLVGGWERLGIRTDIALNIPSAIGFSSMGILIFMISHRLFKSIYISALSTLFTYLNGSLTWIPYLEKHNYLLGEALRKLTSQTSFASFAPWDSGIISAFWNLNIYTNQRHLAYSFALSLLIIYLCLSKQNKLLYLAGFIFGLLLLLNQPVALILGIFLFSFFIVIPHTRKSLFISSLGAIPWIIIYFSIFDIPSKFELSFGFLQKDYISPISFFMYWFSNIGLHLLLIPLGLILSFKKSKAFIIPLVMLFIIPNLIKFSPDLINNHKFFNYFLLVGGIFSAYAIKRLNLVGMVLLPFLVLGGVVDIFPLLNDRYVVLPDVKANSEAVYFSKTPTDSIVLNSTWFYHPASLAGRRIYNGYPYFTWSYGYDQVARERSVVSIYSSENNVEACQYLTKIGIDYVELSPSHEDFLIPNQQVWSSEFVPDYVNPTNGIKIFKVKSICNP